MNARVIHRQLAWIAGVAAVLWASTGFLHPIMSWTAPRAAVQAPPSALVATTGIIAPGPAFAAAGVSETGLVRLVESGGRRYWFAVTPERRHVTLDAQSGAVVDGVDKARAIDLARHYAALPEGEVGSARKIERFSDDYPQVNKLLPVWEVRFARLDGLTMYVESGADRLAMTTNDQRRVLLALFQHIHTLKFLEPVEPLRLLVLAGLVGAVLATALFGATMLFSAKGRGMRRWHRLIAWVALPITMAFTVSGLFHLAVTSSFNDAPAARATPFDVRGFVALPKVAGVDRADVSVSADENRAPIVRVGLEESAALYFDARGAMLARRDEEEARRLAGAPDDAPVTPISAFGETYGFVNKRLPVYQVGEGADAAFVDLREGLVAARAETGVKAIEAWTFDTIHKWEPVAGIVGRRNRDYLTMIAVAVIAMTALFGLWLAATRRRGGESA